jgi:hypothetical protein
MLCWQLLSSPTNVHPDLPEVEHEHMHRGFLGACEGKRKIIGVEALLQQEGPDN